MRVDIIITLALGLLLTACGTAPPPAPTVTVTCLPLVEYDATFDAQLEAAKATLPKDSPILRTLLDYETLRDTDRACLAANPGVLK